MQRKSQCYIEASRNQVAVERLSTQQKCESAGWCVPHNPRTPISAKKHTRCHLWHGSADLIPGRKSGHWSLVRAFPAAGDVRSPVLSAPGWRLELRWKHVEREYPLLMRSYLASRHPGRMRSRKFHVLHRMSLYLPTQGCPTFSSGSIPTH